MSTTKPRVLYGDAKTVVTVESLRVPDAVKRRIEFWKIGSKDCEWILGNSEDVPHRPISRPSVNEYKDLMSSPDWKTEATGTIVLDENFKVWDGRHRLTAIMELGIEVEVPIEFIPKGMSAMDFLECRNNVRPLKPKDVLGMMDQVRGKKLDPRSLASFLTLLWRWRSGVVGTKSPRKPSSWAIKRLFDQCDKQRIVASVKMSAAGLQQEGALRFAHYILGTKLPNDRDDFFRRLLTGAELGAQNPILHLRTRLAKSERYERKLGRDEVIALVFKAWNFLRLGKRVSLLAWKHEEEFPMPVDTGVQIQQGHDLRAGDATKVATEPAFYRQSGQLGRRAAIANKNGSAPKADISEKSRTKAEA